MNTLRFTKSPNKRMWTLVIFLVAVLGGFVLLIGCQPTTYDSNPEPTPVAPVLQSVLQEDQETAVWEVPRQKLTRTYDKKFGIVCYTYTDLNDFGMLECFQVDDPEGR